MPEIELSANGMSGNNSSSVNKSSSLSSSISFSYERSELEKLIGDLK